MSLKKFFKFFSSEGGQKVVLGTVIIAGATSFTLCFAPHNFGIYKYKEFVQAYKNGIERVVSTKIEERYQRAVQLLNLSEFKKKHIKPFVVFGFDIYNCGSTGSRFGGLVGVPTNYFYETAADIEKSSIKFSGGESINWNDHAGKLLEEALIVNEDEQVFGMAREMLMLDTNKVLLQSLYPPASFLLAYTIANQVNIRAKYMTKPLGFRFIMYSMVSVFAFGIYCFLTDFTEIHFETKADKRLALLGPDVVDAGIRFYDKLLKKNRALRELMGTDTYTAMGNVNYLLRQKTLPLTIRKQYFEQVSKEYEADAAEKASKLNSEVQ